MSNIDIQTVTFTVPKNLPSGQYLVRIEQIALHVASTFGGGQNMSNYSHETFEFLTRLLASLQLNSTSAVPRLTSQEVEAASLVPSSLFPESTPATSLESSSTSTTVSHQSAEENALLT